MREYLADANVFSEDARVRPNAPNKYFTLPV